MGVNKTLEFLTDKETMKVLEGQAKDNLEGLMEVEGLKPHNVDVALSNVDLILDYMCSHYGIKNNDYNRVAGMHLYTFITYTGLTLSTLLGQQGSGKDYSNVYIHSLTRKEAERYGRALIHSIDNRNKERRTGSVSKPKIGFDCSGEE